jgi:isopenicillin-N N-acyltransferase-like protein
VRKVLTGKNFTEAEKILIHAPVTSGHNYLLSHQGVAGHYEISPDLVECVSKIESNEFGDIFHTNHCLGAKHKLREDAISANSTTIEREAILVRKMPSTQSSAELIKLLQDHEEYPKSICSHYSSSIFDPALTCGAGVFDHHSGELTFWRGCPHEDKHYLSRSFILNQQTFRTGLIHG